MGTRDMETGGRGGFKFDNTLTLSTIVMVAIFLCGVFYSGLKYIEHLNRSMDAIVSTQTTLANTQTLIAAQGGRLDHIEGELQSIHAIGTANNLALTGANRAARRR